MKAHLLCALVKLFNGNGGPTRLLELRGSPGSTKNDLGCTQREARARLLRAPVGMPVKVLRQLRPV